jgi:hypothetical protein
VHDVEAIEKVPFKVGTVKLCCGFPLQALAFRGRSGSLLVACAPAESPLATLFPQESRAFRFNQHSNTKRIFLVALVFQWLYDVLLFFYNRSINLSYLHKGNYGSAPASSSKSGSEFLGAICKGVFRRSIVLSPKGSAIAEFFNRVPVILYLPYYPKID